MGNRAVITTDDNFANDGVGIYVHWNGGRDSVEAFLKYCELKGYRSPSDDCYGWARLAQVIGNFFGGELSVGIDTIWHLDRENGDNGVYIIKDWKIVDRYYFYGQEQDSYDISDMLVAIDECMPENEQLGEEFLKATEYKTDELEIGDLVFYKGYGEHRPSKYIVIAKKEDLNAGKKFPVIACYGRGIGEQLSNPNNVLRAESYRAVKGGMNER